jgi:hypothetical protein
MLLLQTAKTRKGSNSSSISIWPFLLTQEPTADKIGMNLDNYHAWAGNF